MDQNQKPEFLLGILGFRNQVSTQIHSAFSNNLKFFLEYAPSAQPSRRQLKAGLTTWGGDKLWRPMTRLCWSGCEAGHWTV